MQVAGAAGVAAGGDDAPAVRRVLARELQAEPFVGSGDQNGKWGQVHISFCRQSCIAVQGKCEPDPIFSRFFLDIAQQCAQLVGAHGRIVRRRLAGEQVRVRFPDAVFPAVLAFREPPAVLAMDHVLQDVRGDMGAPGNCMRSRRSYRSIDST